MIDLYKCMNDYIFVHIRKHCYPHFFCLQNELSEDVLVVLYVHSATLYQSAWQGFVQDRAHPIFISSPINHQRK